MCTSEVKEAKYNLDDRAKQFKRNKIDQMTRDAQSYAGDVSSKAHNYTMSGIENTLDATTGVAGRELTRIANFVGNNQGSEGSGDVSDVASANYSKSSSEKASKTNKKGQKKTGEGTGGSKRQFYATKK